LETLARLGYRRPEEVTSALRAWHHGRVPAMRTARARELLTAITPKLLRMLAESGEADLAFARFSAFFTRLNAGVQALSLLHEQPTLIAKLARALALSERLAEALGRRPQAFDAMTEPRFSAPLARDPEGERASLFAAHVASAGGFEPALNAARRLWREEAFRIDWQTLQGEANAKAAGRAHADLAEAVTRALAAAAAEETARRFGAPPGQFTILALGKFGGRELAEGSDLDLMVVFDAPRETGAAEYFTRFTQRLITALSSPTEEGLLYEVDMQLRPSGSKGPVAVRRSAFNSYYLNEAWTWEHLALTRARPVAGDAALSAALAEEIAAILQRPRDVAKLKSDAADMRARMEKERPGKGLWDLKLQPGALVDIEFIAQTLQIAAAAAHQGVLRANTGEALSALMDCGVLSRADAASLQGAWALHSALQQVLRVAVGETFAPARASAALKMRLADVGGVANFAALETELAARQRETRAIFHRLIG
jgi:glutamate-ammonia-ligase adenylyltransferase